MTLFILEIIGTVAFALSGIRLAADKKFDLFGLYCVGLATAIGGGTVRDMLLGIQPFWFNDEWVLWVTLLSLGVFWIFSTHINRIAGTIFLFDTIGLGIFTEIGISKGLGCGCSMIVAIIVGVITGCGGGIVRDICINEEPLVFRKEIYALAGVGGGIVYFILKDIGCSEEVYRICCIASVILIRLLSMKFHWQLPVIKKN